MPDATPPARTGCCPPTCMKPRGSSRSWIRSRICAPGWDRLRSSRTRRRSRRSGRRRRSITCRNGAAQIERQLGAGPFANGAALSVADLKVYVALTPFLQGKIDHVPATVFDGAPALKRLWNAVHELAAVKEWQKRA